MLRASAKEIMRRPSHRLCAAKRSQAYAAIGLTGAILLTVLGTGASAAAGGTETPIEFAIKAAFIYKFLPYVDWPANTFPSPSSPLSICVLGDDGVSALLEQAATGQHLNAHPVTVRHLQASARDTSCQVVYIAESDPQIVATDLNSFHGAPVLTITDSDRSPGALGVIAFTIRDNRVRFIANDTVAAQDGLVISSKLLSLAYSVKQRP